jgi:hypothetical protein
MGIFGHVNAATGFTYGVQGISDSTSGIGVFGKATATSGTTYGIGAQADSTSGTAVRGDAIANSGNTYGGRFESQSSSGTGVYGIVSATSGINIGVYGRTLSNVGYGVFGEATHGTGSGLGVYGRSLSANGYGVWAENTTGGYALYSNGWAYVNGVLNVTGAKNFRIDHPLDPANKYLVHTAIESPEMINFYSGNVVLDANGEASVQLPEWFGVLNREFRYQLTAVGGPGPNLYVANEIEGNRFEIAGGRPGMKVSWQVTGVRQDPYAEANRTRAEEAKPDAERGYYLYPEGYGQPKERGIEYVRRSLRGDASLATAESR